MSDCNHQCSSCSTSSGCQEKEQNERVINNTKGVRSVIGVVGGKGGVGKSLVTSLLAIQTQRLGYRAAVLDADITGPSIPKIFGIHQHAQTEDDNLLPFVTAEGTKVMSLNLLLENETDPVFWRDRVPEPAAGWYHHRFHPAVAGFHDRAEGSADGTEDGHSGSGHGREYAVSEVSGLRQRNSAVWLG